jgi:hypothetical protein
VRSILDEFQKHAMIHRERGVMTMEFPLPTFRPDELPRVTLQRSAMYRALVRAAQGLLSLRRVHHREESPERNSAGGKAKVALLETRWSRERESLGESREGPSSARPSEVADE